MTPEFRWLNEPPAWKETGGELEVTTGDKTDFWRKTHYDFIRDDGHFRYCDVEGDFTATLAFSGEYRRSTIRRGSCSGSTRRTGSRPGSSWSAASRC